MKKLQKMLAFLLILVLAVTMLSGCSSTEESSSAAESSSETAESSSEESESSSESESSEETSSSDSEESSSESAESSASTSGSGELAEGDTIASALGWTVPDETLTISIYYNSSNFSLGEEQKVGMEAMKEYLLKYLNVDYEVMTTDGDASEQLNLLLSSDSYPDIIVGCSTADRDKFISQGRAVDLTDYLPDLENVQHRFGSMLSLYQNDEGRILYLPNSFSNLMDLPDYSAHIRYDEWLEIGSPDIETPEDYYNAIMAIYELHPTTDEGEQRYTLSFYNTGMPEEISGYWGLQDGWKVNDDNTLTYWTETEEGKKMAKFFNAWWRTGTMDPDSMINDWDELRTKISQERVIGMIGGWWIGYNAGHEIWSLTDEDWYEEKRFIQVGFKDTDAENAYVTMKNNAGSSWVIVTDKCEDVSGVMTWIDFTLSDKGIGLTHWGMPNDVESYKNPGTYERIWSLYSDGTWEIDSTAKEELVTETWDYNEEGLFGANTGVYGILNYQGRFDDGIHCLWLNQMWYSENKWKNIMFENMDGTIFDGTNLLFLSMSMDEDVTLAETAVEDAWKQYYPSVIMAESDDEFETAWAELQAAVENAGLETYVQYREENYQHNLELTDSE